MAGKAINGVFRRIRALAAVHTHRACSDRDLLGRFLGAEDEAAFTLLVERHGPMVLALCRRLLRDRHEADDACQATFLVLARKARSVRKQESLASWLHGVAYRVSISLRRARARRLRREQAVSKPDVDNVADNDLSWREFRAVLDEELQRLPERYRAPLVLCYLEGKTRDEAAQQLGVKSGTLHGLLDRGRKMLRDRFTRRGLTLSVVLFATALSETTTRAALAPPLVVTVARGALALVRGDAMSEGLIGANVLTLVQEASKAMVMTKLKIGAATVVAACILTGVVGGSLSSVSLAQDTAAAQPKATPAAAPQKSESDAEFIRRISKGLRGIEPSPTEVHFFVSSKEANRRQKLIDLFIQERQTRRPATCTIAASSSDCLQCHRPGAANKPAAAQNQIDLSHLRWVDVNGAIERQLLSTWVSDGKVIDVLGSQRRLVTLQGDLLLELGAVAKEKKEVAGITQKYLDQLQEYVKANPKNNDVADAMQQISLIYRSQGKKVEADAWRDKLLKEHPQSPAAKVLKTSSIAPFHPNPFFSIYSTQFTNPSTINQPYTTHLQNYFSTHRATIRPDVRSTNPQPAPKKAEDKEKPN